MLISRHQPARAGDIHDQDTTAGPCDACPFACLAAVLCVSSLGVDQLSLAATHTQPHDSDLSVTPRVVAWIAMGGNADKTGQVDTQRLRALVRATDFRCFACPVAAVPSVRES